MISYELAKQLKDAGFRQGEGRLVFRKSLFTTPYDNCYAPTLSELIEACEASKDVVYFSLAHDHSKDHWEADVGLRSAKIAHASGETLDVALARLWLLLNPKTV